MANSTYSYDSTSLFRDGKRWFPVMGEIHYSRFPENYWKEALLKMKAGGVDIVSSYVIWIHHEEIENEWDFSGERNLRKFVETIKECGLTMILRIGPWSHAEVRNGGFPDWLLSKCPKYRSNDESYFAEVEKFYKKIFEQVKGLLIKDGGPIIGVQIENEYGHCGGLSGEEGEAHMKRLTQMAKDCGYDVPLYTATGWGGAVTAGLLPVMGGYCDAPWDPRICKIEPSGNYVFTHERNDHAIGCDFGLGEGITFDMTKYPYLTAELGGGLQVTYKRRPVAQPRDISGMSVAKIGSGCNLLGYYMYHGGKNPEGKLTTLEENIASGSLNDLPVCNYDFRAPLGEYGFANGTYNEIRRLSMFVHDYGEELCNMKTYLPEENPLHPEDTENLRYSWRYDNNSEKGYVFVNNYQRLQQQKDMEKTVCVPEEITGKNTNGKISLKAQNGDFYFIPFSKNQQEYKMEMPLCKLNVNGKIFEVVYSPAKVYGEFKTCVDAENCKIYLSSEDSLKAVKVHDVEGNEILLISEGTVFEDNKKIFAETCNAEFSFKAYPYSKDIEGFKKTVLENEFTEYSVSEKVLVKEDEVSFTEKESSDGKKTYSFKIPEWKENALVHDAVLSLDYCGNCARLYKDGKLFDDHIFVGKEYPWEIGLKRYGTEAFDVTMEVDVLKKDAPVYFEGTVPKENSCVLSSAKVKKVLLFNFEMK